MLAQCQSLARLIAEAKAHGLRLVDFLLLDEGELSIPPFVAAIEAGACSGRFDAGEERADVAEIAMEFLACFDALYQPQAFLDRAYRSCLQQGAARPSDARRAGQWRRPPRGVLRALCVLVWRLGIRRSGRWPFWQKLIDLAWRRPRALPDFLWLMLAEEHMLLYARQVHHQVEAQLANPLLWRDEQPGRDEQPVPQLASG